MKSSVKGMVRGYRLLIAGVVEDWEEQLVVLVDGEEQSISKMNSQLAVENLDSPSFQTKHCYKNLGLEVVKVTVNESLIEEAD